MQSVLIEMQKALEKGEVPEEELRALESDVTGKVGVYGVNPARGY